MTNATPELPHTHTHTQGQTPGAHLSNEGRTAD